MDDQQALDRIDALVKEEEDPDSASFRDGGTVEDYGTVKPYDDTDGDAPE
jgi:hypothetical protein